MAVSTVLSACIDGLEAVFIQVEVDISNGLPGFYMVGHAATEVKEAAQRVRTALKNSGVILPAKKIVANLSPGNLRKRGTVFDLPVAVAVLLSLQAVPPTRCRNTLFAGELTLGGAVKEVKGILPILHAARQAGIGCCVIPADNLEESGMISGIRIIGVRCLSEVKMFLKEGALPPDYASRTVAPAADHIPDFAEVSGQEGVKRAVEIAVSGGHNLLLLGPPGSGKTMIASRIPGILPPMDAEEQLEVTKIYSAAGRLGREQPRLQSRPFRQVHHTVTKATLIGGGVYPQPGEISLAHKGVLFTGGTTTISCSCKNGAVKVA